jgi:ligand-binding SRPBCC domain-containing protein
MALITRTQFIKKPVDEVFAVVADGASWADWNPTVRASRRLDAGPIGNGARFEWELRGVGKVVQEFQEFEPNTRVRFVTHVKTIKGGHLFRFSTEGEQTRIDHEVEIRPKGVFLLFAPMMGLIGRKDLRDTANALQAHLERMGDGRLPTHESNDRAADRRGVRHGRST